jgi:hypothetical protein
MRRFDSGKIGGTAWRAVGRMQFGVGAALCNECGVAPLIDDVAIFQVQQAIGKVVRQAQ